MKKTLEKTGRTEEDAVKAALAELGLERDDVSVEIVERAKSGFLGIGASPALIRVSYEVEDEKPQVVSEPEEIAAEEKSTEIQDENADFAAVRSFISGLLEHMGVKAEISISYRENGGINVNLAGAGMGSLL